VIIRAGYGNDSSQADLSFEENYNRAVEAGLMVGTYWFMYARSKEEASAEADACHNVIKGKDLPLGIYYDYEEDTIAYMDRSGSSKDDMTGRIVAFIQRMLELGHERVRWYANPSCIAGKHGADALDQSRLQPYGLWLAAYSDSYKDNPITEFNGYSLCGHQFMNADVFNSGCGAEVDCSYFYSAALDRTDVATSQQKEITPVQDEPQQNVEPVAGNGTYTVQSGDCLSVIAQNLGVSMDELASLNGIQDVNKIYAGEMLQIPGQTEVAPVQQDAPAESTSNTYTVQSGDTLCNIAERAYGDGNRYKEIADLNGIADASVIYPGQILKLN
jgi:LysM repeat protein